VASSRNKALPRTSQIHRGSAGTPGTRPVGWARNTQGSAGPAPFRDPRRLPGASEPARETTALQAARHRRSDDSGACPGMPAHLSWVVGLPPEHSAVVGTRRHRCAAPATGLLVHSSRRQSVDDISRDLAAAAVVPACHRLVVPQHRDGLVAGHRPGDPGSGAPLNRPFRTRPAVVIPAGYGTR
jgi:hypothetical protein